MESRKKKLLTFRKIIAILVIIALIFAALVVAAHVSGNAEGLNVFQQAARQGGAVVSGIATGFGNFFDFSTKRALKSEVRDLNAEITKLKTQLDMAETYKEEYDDIRNLLKYGESVSKKYTYIAAEITGRNADNWYEKFAINKGSADGITVNLPVVTADGLIGRTINVTKNSCEVLLIIDSQGSLGGRVKSAKVEGVLSGISGGKGLLSMSTLPYAADIAIGDVVVTSGEGGVFPKGLKVGTISKVSTSSDGLSRTAIVDPYVDFDGLSNVLILKEKKVKKKNDDNKKSDSKTTDNDKVTNEVQETNDTEKE